jgi:serine/threonine protein kinase
MLKKVALLAVAEHLTLDGVQSFMYQLCKGVAHCHSHGVMHRYLIHHLGTQF